MEPIVRILALAMSLISDVDIDSGSVTVRAHDMTLVSHGARIERVTYQGRDAVKLTETRAVGDTVRQNEPSFAVLEGLEFSEGAIEIAVAARVRPGADTAAARGFTGVAFHVNPAADAYRAFYIRPLNARSIDQIRRNRSVQYIAIPQFPWPRLRREEPGVYEAYVDLVPGAWTTLRIEVAGGTAKFFVGSAEQPTLIVNDLKPGPNSGRFALWIDAGTEAYFGDLRVSPR